LASKKYGHKIMQVKRQGRTIEEKARIILSTQRHVKALACFVLSWKLYIYILKEILKKYYFNIFFKLKTLLKSIIMKIKI